VNSNSYCPPTDETGSAWYLLPDGDKAPRALVRTPTQGLTHGMAWIRTSDLRVPAYFARPLTATRVPVVVVVPDAFGLHEHARDVCRRLAHLGFASVMPAPQAQIIAKPPGKTDEFVRAVLSIPDDAVFESLEACVRWAVDEIAADGARLGVTGFCWGGRFAWLWAARRPNLRVAIAWYGRLSGSRTADQPLHPIDIASTLRVPTLGLYGEADEVIPTTDIAAMRFALQLAPAQCDLQSYMDAPHAFFCDTRKQYVASAAEDGWQRMRQWLENQLLLRVAD
jgi:carboxymethylenebutenolidase